MVIKLDVPCSCTLKGEQIHFVKLVKISKRDNEQLNHAVRNQVQTSLFASDANWWVSMINFVNILDDIAMLWNSILFQTMRTDKFNCKAMTSCWFAFNCEIKKTRTQSFRFHNLCVSNNWMEEYCDGIVN